MKQRWTGVARVLDRVTRETDVRSDTALLEAFLGHDDAEAFARLVRRHGPMVQGVCRRLLGDAHDVEDAFQATFLVLLRKAPSLQWRERLGPWLYGVAHRTALKARARRNRTHAIERPHHAMTHEPATAAMPSLDGMECLDEELLALPEKYRLPLVLCELQGLSRRDAARALKLPEGTLSSRLARGRQLLRRRLVSRGVALTASGLLTLLASEARADVALRLVGATVRVAEALKAGTAAGPVVSLTEGVVKSMLLAKLKVVTALVVLLLTLGGAATGTMAMAWGGDDTVPVAQPAPVAAVSPRPVPDLQPAAMEQFLIRAVVYRLDKAGEKKILASPQLVTLSGQAACFLAGGEQPAAWKEKVDMVDFGTKISVTVRRENSDHVRFQFEGSMDEPQTVDGFDYHITGLHVKCMKVIRLGEAQSIVLRKHDDGKPACCIEFGIDVVTAVASQPAFRGAGQELRIPPVAKPPVLTSPVMGPSPLALDFAYPTLPQVPANLKTYCINLKVLEAAKPDAVPEVLTAPRITTFEGQAARVDVANYPTNRLTLQTIVTRKSDKQVQLHVALTDLKGDRTNGLEVRQVGTAADVETVVELNVPMKLVLINHPDGMERLWAEITVAEGPPTPDATPEPMPSQPPTVPASVLPAPTSAPLTAATPRDFIIDAKLLRTERANAPPIALEDMRIQTLANYENQSSIGSLDAGQYLVTTHVSPIQEGKIRFRADVRHDKIDKSEGTDWSTTGGTTSLSKTIKSGQTETLVLQKHEDGSPRLWMEMTVYKSSQAPSHPTARTPLTVGVPPGNAGPSALSGWGTLAGQRTNLGALTQPVVRTWQDHLQLRHRNTTNGPRVELKIGNVRLEATKLRIGSGKQAYWFTAAPNGIAIQGPALTTVCSEMDFGGGLAVTEVPFSTKEGRFKATYHAIKGEPAVAQIQWGDAEIECTQLEVGNEMALSVHGNGMTMLRGDSIIKAEQIDIDFNKDKITVNGQGIVETRPAKP